MANVTKAMYMTNNATVFPVMTMAAVGIVPILVFVMSRALWCERGLNGSSSVSLSQVFCSRPRHKRSRDNAQTFSERSALLVFCGYVDVRGVTVGCVTSGHVW